MWSDVLLKSEPAQASLSGRWAGKPAGRVGTSALVLPRRAKLGVPTRAVAAARTGPALAMDILTLDYLLAY